MNEDKNKQAKLKAVIERLKRIPVSEWRITDPAFWFNSRVFSAETEEAIIEIRFSKITAISIKSRDESVEMFRYAVENKSTWLHADNDFNSDPLVVFCGELFAEVLKSEKEKEKENKEIGDKLLEGFLQKDK